jgi:hypothetical protein
MTWPFEGYPVDEATSKALPLPPPWWQRALRRGEERQPDDWRGKEPWRREPQEIYSDLRHRWRWAGVMLPRVLAVALGVALFIITAALNASGFDRLHL